MEAKYIFNAAPKKAMEHKSSFYEAWETDDGSVTIFDDTETEVAAYKSRKAAEEEWLLF